MSFRSLTWLLEFLPASKDFALAYSPCDCQAAIDASLTRRVEETHDVEGSGSASLASRRAATGSIELQVSEDTCGYFDSAHVQGGPSSVLKDMLNYVIPGARYNSAARDPPRCCPGTRARMFQDLNSRVHEEDMKIIWLFGAAGSGKTAIMQTLAETLAPQVVVATLFLSRKDMRDDARRIFPSLAYELAVAHSGYRNHVEEQMTLDPDVLSLSLDEQFKRLFEMPPYGLESDVASKRWVVMLDGLDQCKSKGDQCRIIHLISRSTLSRQSQSPLWIISSRNEIHLECSFREVETRIRGFWKQEVSTTGPDACKDVELYLRIELAKLKFPCYLKPSPPWPSNEDVSNLANHSSGFFQYASAAIKHISDNNPVSRLEFLSGQKSAVLLPGLAEFYRDILSQIPQDDFSVASSIMGMSYVLQRDASNQSPSYAPRSLAMTCNVLSITKRDAYAALSHLGSVLTFPLPDYASTSGVEPLHPSLFRFVEHGETPDRFRIFFYIQIQNISRCYVRILQEFKKSNFAAHSGISICFPSAGDTSQEEQQRTLLQVARYGWVSLVIRCRNDRRCDKLHPSHCPNRLACVTVSNLDSDIKQILSDFGVAEFISLAEPQIAAFTHWFTCHVPLNIKNRMFLPKDARVTILGAIRWGQLSQALRDTRFCRRVVSAIPTGDCVASDVDLYFIQGLDDAALRDESGVLKEFHLTKAKCPNLPIVHLRSTEKSRQTIGNDRIIVGPMDVHDPSGDVYYILPY